MKFLVVETYTADGKEFTHFIELTKATVQEDLNDFAKNYARRGEVIRKVYFSNTAMSNW